MFKKSLVIISSILIVAGLFACGNNAEVEELKRQVAELKQQNEEKEEVTRSIDISKSENIQLDKDNTEDSTEKSISMNNIANDEEKDSNQNLTNEELKLLGEYFDIEDTDIPSYDKISLEYL